jgi:ATP-dependent DNA helicase PIF1
VHNYYLSKFPELLTPNVIPPDMIILNIDYPIILLSNIDPMNGLLNGTWLDVRCFAKNSIDAEIVLGQHACKRVFFLEYHCTP